MITYNGTILKRPSSVGARKYWMVYNGGSAISQYFDYGDTYTLTSANAQVISIGDTGIITGDAGEGYRLTRPYTALYMDTTVTASIETGNTFGGIGIVLAGDAGYGVGIGYSQGFFINNPGVFKINPYYPGTSLQQILTSSEATSLSKVGIIIYDDTVNRKWTFCLVYNNGSTWTQTSTNSYDRSNIIDTSSVKLISNGNRSGNLSATNFRCAGFDTFNDASAWITK